MSNITDLKDQINTKTANLLMLSFVTGGIYLVLWLQKNYPIFDKITKSQTADDKYILWIAVCLGLGGFFSSYVPLLGLFLTGASIGLYIKWAFRAKIALQNYALKEHKIDLKMNTFYVLILNAYYINYCINNLQVAQITQKNSSGRGVAQ